MSRSKKEYDGKKLRSCQKTGRDNPLKVEMF
jgi:hypothetical protein